MTKSDWKTWMLSVLVPLNMSMAGLLVKIIWNDLDHLTKKVETIAELEVQKEAGRAVERINTWAAWAHQSAVNELVLIELQIPRHLWPAPPYWLTAMGPSDSTRWR